METNLKQEYTECEEKIDKGIEFLNDLHPDWFLDIRLGVFDISNCYTCVLGQLYGDFFKAIKEIEELHKDNLYDLGFCIPFENYSIMQEIWKDKIFNLKLKEQNKNTTRKYKK